MSSYLHALTSLCNKVHVQCHSNFIVLEENETVRDTIKKPVKNLTFGKGLEKGIYPVLQLGLLVMWQPCLLLAGLSYYTFS